MAAVLKFFGSPKKNKGNKQSLVETLEGPQPCNPFTEVQVLMEHSNIVRILVTIDNRRFASGGDDTTVIVWDLQHGKKVYILQGHSRPITSLHLLDTTSTAFSSGCQLISAASDKLICIWDVDEGRLLKQITEHHSTARCFLSLPGDKFFCSGGSKLCLWRHDGRLVDDVTRDKEEDIIELIHLKEHLIVGTVDKRLVVYSVKEANGAAPTLTLFRRLSPHREAIKCLLKINDACFVSGSLDGTIVLWSSQALAPSRYFNSIDDYLGEHRVYPHSIQSLLCLEERYLVCAVGTGICIYDIITGRTVAEKLRAHHSKITAMDTVQNGELLATVSEDGAVRIWGSHKSCKVDVSSTNGETAAITKLLGVSKEDLRLLREQKEKIEPHLVGECLGHSGAINVCRDAKSQGFLTCGVDGLISCWKDGLTQKMKRNRQLQDFYRSLNVTS